MTPEVNEAVSEVMAELAEAEAAEAEARAEAARAKAKAARLRSSAEAKPTVDESPDVDDDAAEAPDPEPEPARGWWTRVPWSKLGLAAGVLVIAALLTLSGLMFSHHRQVNAKRAHEAEYVTAARKGVVALLSIDYNHAKADVQRGIDSSTGSFRDDFVKNADDFVKTAEQSKAVTQGSITSAALESLNGDTGVVLLAAKSQVTNSSGAHQDPRAWRMSVTVTGDAGQLKMSNVEFVP